MNKMPKKYSILTRQKIYINKFHLPTILVIQRGMVFVDRDRVPSQSLAIDNSI